MISTPHVSVIVPVYNAAKTLDLCLRALRRQTHTPLEIIVVDDRSTDDSARIARSLGVRVVTAPVNGGVAAARNLGAAHAAGSILFFVDSDVAADPYALEHAVRLLRSDPAIGAVGGVYEPDPLIRDGLVEECRALQAHYWRVSSEGTVSFLFPSVCAIPAAVFAEVGPFNPRLRHTEEVDYGFRLSQRYEVRLSARVRGHHDDDDRLVPLLRKLCQRGRLRVPLYARMRRFARGFETASRAWGSLAALLAPVTAVAAVPLALTGGWAGGLAAAVPALLLAASVAADLGMYRFVARTRGPAFCVPFAGVQFLVNVAIMVGVLAGAAQWLCSAPFRRLYEELGTAAGPPPGGPPGPAGTSAGSGAAPGARTGGPAGGRVVEPDGRPGGAPAGTRTGATP